ncbi:MAG: VacJ family lipoprotein [Rhodospirillaceae bacterium]|nr:VacJ family lipoprotein [Rhodospirillaceae bacterium]
MPVRNSSIRAPSRRRAGLVAVALLIVAGCAKVPSDPEERAAFEAANDPLEPMNRYSFEVNYALDELLFKPLAGWYWLALPDFAHDRIQGVLDTLNAPAVLVNDLLQGEWARARITASRFAINATFGIAGMFDVATGWGFPGHDEDFGQTLAVWGVPEGPYLVLPVLGPSSVRDAAAGAVDSYMDPFSYLETTTGMSYVLGSRRFVGGLEKRWRNLDALNALREGSLDYYATLRSVYRQNRDYEIRNGREAEPATPGQAPGGSEAAPDGMPDLNATLQY